MTTRAPEYHEIQRLPRSWVLGLGLPFAIGLPLLVAQYGHAGESTPAVVVVAAAVPALVLVLLLCLRLETRVTAGELRVRFLPFLRRRYPLETLKAWGARRYRPIREYGGWGIRFGLRGQGWAYNLHGNRGVQLVFRDGRRLLVGSQTALELEEAISRWRGGPSPQRP